MVRKWLARSASISDLETMPDNLTQEQRRYCMSRVKGRDTGLETRVRSELHKKGFRFRKHLGELPGKPDIAFTKARVAVFLDGDFWHGFEFETWQDRIPPFWQAKISKTIDRDRKYDRQLREMGWTVLRLWQHQVDRDFEASVKHITSAVSGKSATSMARRHNRGNSEAPLDPCLHRGGDRRETVPKTPSAPT